MKLLIWGQIWGQNWGQIVFDFARFTDEIFIRKICVCSFMLSRRVPYHFVSCRIFYAAFFASRIKCGAHIVYFMFREDFFVSSFNITIMLHRGSFGDIRFQHRANRYAFVFDFAVFSFWVFCYEHFSLSFESFVFIRSHTCVEYDCDAFTNIFRLCLAYRYKVLKQVQA